MTIALHACCAPCLLEPLDDLAAHDEVVVVYANPNIAPREEYERRRDTLLDHARDAGLKVEVLAYDPQAWQRAVAGIEHDDALRCAACYRLRLGMTAKWAVANGMDTIATTLTVSPYQDAGSIREAGQHAAERAGVRYLHRDYRDRYRAGAARARELGMYRQNYCGCLISGERAERERTSKRAEREAARAARPTAHDD